MSIVVRKLLAFPVNLVAHKETEGGPTHFTFYYGDEARVANMGPEAATLFSRFVQDTLESEGDMGLQELVVCARRSRNLLREIIGELEKANRKTGTDVMMIGQAGKYAEEMDEALKPFAGVCP